MKLVSFQKQKHLSLQQQQQRRVLRARRKLLNAKCCLSPEFGATPVILIRAPPFETFLSFFNISTFLAVFKVKILDEGIEHFSPDTQSIYLSIYLSRVQVMAINQFSLLIMFQVRKKTFKEFRRRGSVVLSCRHRHCDVKCRRIVIARRWHLAALVSVFKLLLNTTGVCINRHFITMPPHDESKHVRD